MSSQQFDRTKRTKSKRITGFISRVTFRAHCYPHKDRLPSILLLLLLLSLLPHLLLPALLSQQWKDLLCITLTHFYQLEHFSLLAVSIFVPIFASQYVAISAFCMTAWTQFPRNHPYFDSIGSTVRAFGSAHLQSGY